MSTLAYSKKFVDIKPDLKDPSLVGAWGMRNVDGKLVDVTGLGNDGTPGNSSIVEQTLLGRFRRYLPNSGALASTLGGANAFPLADVTVSFWYRKDLGSALSRWIVNYFQSTTAAWGVRQSANQLFIFDDIDNAGATLYAEDVENGMFHHVVLVMDALENLLYLNGELVGSGTSSADAWSSFTGTLYHGGRRTNSVTDTHDGIVSPSEVYNEAKSAAWVKQKYAQGAQAIQFRTDFGVQESMANQTAGRLGGPANMSPYSIIAGTWNLTHEGINGRLTKTNNNVAAGAITTPTRLFEATPTGAAFGAWLASMFKGADANNTQWMPIASDNDRRNGATQNGYQVAINSAEAVQLNRITNGAPAGTVINSGNDYVAINTWYEFFLTRRYDGYFELYIKGGAFTAWTLVGSGTDLTHTVANYVVWDLDALDRSGYSDELGGHGFVKYEGVWRPAA
jgi:hypothetical protein